MLFMIPLAARASRHPRTLAITLAALVAASAATPVAAADTGTVGATVTVRAAACLELSTTSIGFGSLALGAEDQPATPDVVVTNCSTTSATLLARGSDAADAAVSWNLIDVDATCGSPLFPQDSYRLSLAVASVPTPIRLAETNKTIQSLAGSASATHTARIWTACPGSTGIGATLSMQITYLATS